MQIYIIRRLILVVPTVILASMIIFLLVRFVPGDVIDLIEAELASAQAYGEVNRDEIARSLGLDVPIHIQYGRWIGILPYPDEGWSGIIQGDLGKSLRSGYVAEEILSRLPVSLELGILSLIIALLIGLPIGIFSAVRQDTLGDYAARSFAIILISVPGFWIATMVMIYPTILWGWTPPMEYIPFMDNPIKNLEMFVIPAAIMGANLCGASMRMMRTMMLEVMRQDYIRTAWSKGLKEWLVIMRHALKNALIPVVTVIGMQLTFLIGGMVIIEQIFNLPGMGRLLLDSLNQRDYPIVSAINLIIVSFVLICNLAIDLTYGYLDPRIRYQ